MSALTLLQANLVHRPFSTIITNLNDENRSYLVWPRMKSTKLIYLIGDSHVEFYGRCSKVILEDNFGPYVLWLGPKTFLGGYFSGLANEWVEYCSKLVNYIEKDDLIEQRYFAFSLGSIDIRCMFFQLLRFGPKISFLKLMDKFESAVDYFFLQVVCVMKARYPGCGVGVFEVLYCTDLPGESVTSDKEIKELLKLRPYPILGTFDERSAWCEDINEVISLACKRHGIDFLPVNRYLKVKDGRKALAEEDSGDRFHTTNQYLIDNILSEVVNCMRGRVC
ncbi:MAG: hypothetical protein HQL78_07040 [Magnetococcales bacterium]|nr:hypothetical protein [Magnetococcales bacterium]